MTIAYIMLGLAFIAMVFQFILELIVALFTQDKLQIHDDAFGLLYTECKRIAFTRTSDHPFYTNPIFEATRQNASRVVIEIVYWFPDAIWSANEDGHNFIQYSVINRSEKVYSLLYQMSEHKNRDGAKGVPAGARAPHGFF